jgi:membrane protein implicated in regulation of membrane protease activity
MNAMHLWLGAGLTLCALELLVPGIYLLWLGLAGLGTGLVLAAVPLGFGAQVAVAIVAAGLSVLAGRSVQRAHGAPDPNRGADLLGGSCQALAFDGAEGRVRFRDGEWPARLQGSAPTLPGARLQVVGREGTTLLVAPAGETA